MLFRSCLMAIERGVMTGDLVPLFKADGVTARSVSSREFLKAIAAELENA